MTTFVLRTEDDDDLGFLMFADHEGEWPPPGINDCTISGFAFDPDVLRSPRGEWVMDHKHEEYRAAVSYTETTMTVEFDTPDGWSFRLTSNEEDGSSWTLTRAGEVLEGTGEFI